MTDIVQSLRDLNVAVVHPFDRTGEELRQQLSRIGCEHEAFWPPPNALPDRFHVVITDLPAGAARRLAPMLVRGRQVTPTVIAIVGYENPSILAQLGDIGAHGVLTKPLRPIGVMSAIVMARQCWSEQIALREENEKIRRKMENLQKINDAKLILMRHHGIDDRQAYGVIRKQAMSRRMTIIEIAHAIITADHILGNFRPNDFPAPSMPRSAASKGEASKKSGRKELG